MSVEKRIGIPLENAQEWELNTPHLHDQKACIWDDIFDFDNNSLDNQLKDSSDLKLKAYEKIVRFSTAKITKAKQGVFRDDKKVRNNLAARRHRQRKKQDINQIKIENKRLKDKLKTLSLTYDFNDKISKIGHIEKLVKCISCLLAPNLNLLLKSSSLQEIVCMHSSDTVLASMLYRTDLSQKKNDCTELNFLSSLIKLINET